jgi:hypothetical protein
VPVPHWLMKICGDRTSLLGHPFPLPIFTQPTTPHASTTPTSGRSVGWIAHCSLMGKKVCVKAHQNSCGICGGSKVGFSPTPSISSQNSQFTKCFSSSNLSSVVA